MFTLNKEELESKLKEVINKDERKLVQYEYAILVFYETYLSKLDSI
jgi:hypothetical protein